jgi:hypothetical protein
MGRSAYGHDEGQDDIAAVHGAAGYDAEEQRAARSLLFAGSVIGLVSVSNVVAGVAAVSDSNVFPRQTVFAFWDIHTWGVIMLVLGLVGLYASFAIFTGSAFARGVGIAVAAVNAVAQLFFAPAHPVWSTAVLAADLFAVKALVTHGGERLFRK